MATRSELVARNRTSDEVAEAIGADFLIYQELEDLIAAAQAGNPEIQNFCSACFSGHYPTQDITPEMFEALENERLCVRD